jgi:thioredoxin reductase (NADPH)
MWEPNEDRLNLRSSAVDANGLDDANAGRRHKVADQDSLFSQIEYVRDQANPHLSDAEISRVQRFGTLVSWRAGDAIYQTGRVACGVLILLRGNTRTTRRDVRAQEHLVSERGPGHLVGEAAELCGNPSLVDVYANSDVHALQLTSEQLRALMMADIEVGEKILRALIRRRAILVERGWGSVIVGDPTHPRVVALEGFLRRNDHPHTVIDALSDIDAKALIEHIAPPASDLPIVVCPDGTMLRAPSESQLASCLGWLPAFEIEQVYDVAIVGAGPAGLATAVYAASEGLRVAVLDTRAPGGQAGASARIENFLGFPMGISGQALAGRAIIQAQKFGAHLFIPSQVKTFRCEGNSLSLVTDTNRSISARTVVIASGAAYRRPSIKGLDRFEGRGVYYWASPIEAKLCASNEVIIVGGGNSAGQAAAYLASHAKLVRILVRRENLEATMSRYLIERLDALPNVRLEPLTEIERLDGDEHGLGAVHCTSKSGRRSFAVRHLFLFTGADANTSWLRSCDVDLDAKGFVLTGADVTNRKFSHAMPLETSVRRVFAVGDVRSASVKRVAAAAGDGAAVVAQLHMVVANQSTLVTRGLPPDWSDC